MRIYVPFPGTRERSGASRPARRRRRWLLAPLLLIVIAAIALWWLQRGTAPPATTSTARVSQDTLTIAVSGSGTVAAARTVDVPFQQTGTVTSVDVKVGDEVVAGQALARIETDDLELQLQLADANLKAAQASLEQVKSGSTTAADIRSAQAQLAASQAQLDALTNPSQTDVSAAEGQVAQAQTALQSTRDSASQSKTNAQLALQNAVNSLTQAQASYASAKSNWEYVQATGQDPANPETKDSTGKTVKNKLSDAQQQQYYNAFVQAEAALRSAENGVTQAQVAYDTARQQEVSQVTQAEAVVQDAQRQLDALRDPTAAELAQAKASVTQAQAGLDKLSEPATEADLAAAAASVLQAQAAFDTAQRALAQATLTAPFAGVVSAVNIAAGSLASSGAAAVTIVDRSALHADVSLSETDAADVKVGQPVTLTFDALPDLTLTGTVATISPAATTEQNVVTYPVQIAFDPAEAPVKVGMTATAEIQIQQYENAILVPSRAVQTSGDVKTVTVLQGAEQAPVVVEVETGVTADGQTVVTGCVATGEQCLQPGDVIAVTTATGASTQTTAQSGGMGGLRGLTGGPPPGP